MSVDKLRELYEQGHLDNPSRLRAYRSEIREETDLIVPQRLADVRNWWDRKKSVFARRLSVEEDAVEEEPTEESEPGE